jgi:hypothetical protein
VPFAYSTWGASWGASWAASWGSGVVPPIVVVPDTHDGDRKRKRKFQEDEEARARRRKQIQDAYEVLLEGRPEVVEAIAAPFVDAPKTPGIAIQTPSVNWEALLDDLDAAERLYAAYVELDDEEVLLLL